ncbi:MAG: hypothetical protein ACLGH3_07430 [Actinomycetota bacterium]
MADGLPPKQPGEIELDRRILIAVLVAIGLLVAGLLALDSRPEGAVTPSPEPTPSPQLIPVTAPTEQACPEGWEGFVNPAFLYELCRPSPWRVIYEGQPRARLPLGDLAEVRFVNPQALPWPTGSDPVQVVLERSSLDLRIVANQTPKGCEPKQPLDGKLVCDYQANRSLSPDDQGSLQVMIVAVPVEAPGEPIIHAIAVMPTNQTAAYSSLLELVLSTLQRISPDIAL